MEKLRSYTEDADKFTTEFQTLILGFALSSRNIQFLLASCCTSTEKKKILSAAKVGEAFARDTIGIPWMSLSQQLSLTGIITIQEEFRGGSKCWKTTFME
jgi:hypothetical protein